MEGKKFIQDNRQLPYYRRDIPAPTHVLLSDIFDVYLREIHFDKGMLENFYVNIKPKRFTEGFTQSALMKISPLKLRELLSTTTNDAFFINEIFLKNIANFSQINLISPIGTGKTTFLNHLIKIQIGNNKLFSSVHPIYIDLSKMLMNLNSIINEIIDIVENNLISSIPDIDYRRISQDEWQRIKIFLYKDELKKHGYIDNNLLVLKKHEDRLYKFLDKKINCSGYGKINFVYRLHNYARVVLKSKIYPIIIVDNIDHLLPFLENRIIWEILSIARKLDIPILIAFRESSIRTEIETNPLGLDFNNSFALDEPDFKLIAKKRLRKIKEEILLMLKNIDNEEQVIIPESAYSSDEIWNKKLILTGCLKAINILLEEKKVILDTLIYLSNFNIREFLKLIKTILLSIHTFAKFYKDNQIKAVDIKASTSILKSLIVGDKPYYDDKDINIKIINLFESGLPEDYVNHFIKIRILQYLDNYAYDGILIEDLIEVIRKIYNKLQPHTIISLSYELFKKGLISKYSDYFNIDKNKGAFKNYYNDMVSYPLFITFNGQLHINYLIYEMVYLEEMRFVTQIFSDIYYYKMFPDEFSGNLKDTINSGLNFVSYLENMEIKEYENCGDKDIYNKYFKRVTGKIKSNYFDKAATLWKIIK